MQEKAKEYATVFVDTTMEAGEYSIDFVREHDFLRGAEALYSELKPKIEWVDVNERLPEYLEKVLVKTDSNDIFACIFYDKHTFRFEFNEARYAVSGVKFWREI